MIKFFKPTNLFLFLFLFFLSVPTQAQIIRDSSLGTMKNQQLVGPHYEITPEMGKIRGPNLFQSFSQFDLNTLPNGTIESATFSGPNTISRILTRVTGTEISRINGLLQSTIPGVNLYFLNPRGVLFGPNASFNVGGSVYISTADFLRFMDGAKFYANLSQTSTFSSEPIAAFGFLGPTVGAIANDGGVLQVATGQKLALIGGDLSIQEGILAAPSGQVQMASVASAGEVIPVNDPLSPNLILDGFSNLGTITLVGSLLSTDRSGAEGGTLLFRGGRLIVDGSGILADTQGDTNGAPVGIDIHLTKDLVLKNASLVASRVAGSGSSGAINITADTVEVGTGSLLTSASFPPLGSGKPGDITVSAARVLITTQGVLESFVNNASSQGAGSVRVLATESVSIVGELTRLSSSSNGAGDAGSIFISAPLVELREGGSIQAFILGTGKGGPIEIQGQRVLLVDGGQIFTDSIGGVGGGAVTITAADSITITGQREGRFGVNPSLVSTSTSGLGDAGAITLSAPLVALSNTAVLQSDTFGQGNAGAINIAAARLTVTGGAQMRNTASPDSSGKGGTLNVTASESVIISGQSNSSVPSALLSDTSGTGDGGSMTISSPAITIEHGALISSSSTAIATGNAGSVTLQGTASPAQTLRVDGSSLLTSAEGTGAGGNITLSAEQVTLKGATISGTSNSGKAGNIAIKDAKDVTIRDSTISTAVSGAGAGGSITISASSANTLGLTHTIITGTVNNVGSEPGLADITFTAPTIDITGGGIVAQTTGSRNAGTITLNVDHLITKPGTKPLAVVPGEPPTTNVVISSSSIGNASGNAGTVKIQGLAGTGSLPVSLALAGTELSTAAEGTGAGGTIVLSAQGPTNPNAPPAEQALILDHVTISASVRNVPAGGVPSDGVGNLAVIAPVSAPRIKLIGGRLVVETTGSRNAGSITVKGSQVTIEGGATISSSSTGNATGNAGSVSVQGLASPAQILSVNGSSLLTSAEGSGAGGNLLLSGENITLTGVTVSATANSGKAGGITLADATTITAIQSSLTTESVTGEGGTITIANSGGTGINLTTTTVSASVKSGTQAGGDVTITAAQTLGVFDASILAESTGKGNAGDILLNAGNTIQLVNSTVTTEAAIASGGNITLQAPYLIQLTNSTVSSSVAGGVQTIGGNIVIDPQFLILQNSQIIAQAFAGQGGNILINAGVFLADASSVVDASSQLGISGTVTVNSPIQNLSGALVPLKQGLLTTAMSGDRCAADPSGKFSSFVQVGRDGMPPEPGNFAASPLSLEELEGRVSPGTALPMDSLMVRRLNPLGSGEVISRFSLMGCRVASN